MTFACLELLQKLTGRGLLRTKIIIRLQLIVLLQRRGIYTKSRCCIPQIMYTITCLGRDQSLMDPTSAKTTSLKDILRQPTSVIPGLLSAFLNLGPVIQTTTVTSPEAIINNKLVLTHRQAEETTRRLIIRLGQASNPAAVTACIDVLNEHLIRFPACKALVWQGKSVVALLKLRRTYRNDQGLQDALREALALIGYVDPIKGHGIRVLSIDGGGTR
ncbi:hypothetical protein AMECASPLE_009385 [Ameca splendens]|uniref:PNPLA domain-containing protein n=1 Tax=Ameca splendens TaxID=208324 RepID=A0ABV0Y0H3_9TELE